MAASEHGARPQGLIRLGRDGVDVSPKSYVLQSHLVELESRGLIVLPRQTERTAFQGPAFPSRGKLASEMVSEDRR